MTVIVKNNGGSPVWVDDLGVSIPATSQVTLSDLFELSEILDSKSLDTLILNSTLVVNNGTSDLSAIDGDKYLQIENVKDSDAGDVISVLNDLTDVNAPTPSGGYVLTYNSTSGKWEASAGGVGDMITSIYDPTSISGDAFDLTNHFGTIPISAVSGLTDELTTITNSITAGDEYDREWAIAMAITLG
jgi:hypothetical protein